MFGPKFEQYARLKSSPWRCKEDYIFGPVIGSFCITSNNSVRADASPSTLSTTMDREMERMLQQAQAAGMPMRTDQATPDKCVDYI